MTDTRTLILSFRAELAETLQLAGVQPAAIERLLENHERLLDVVRDEAGEPASKDLLEVLDELVPVADNAEHFVELLSRRGFYIVDRARFDASRKVGG